MEEQIQYPLVAEADESEKVEFYKKTYLHVAFAILAFLGVETLLINLVPVDIIVGMMSSKMTWLFIIGLFWLISIMVDKFAFSPSKSQQYFGLGLYVFIEAIIFLPMIYITVGYTEGYTVLGQAVVLTLSMFTGISAIAFFSKKIFLFYVPYL